MSKQRNIDIYCAWSPVLQFYTSRQTANITLCRILYGLPWIIRGNLIFLLLVWFSYYKKMHVELRAEQKKMNTERGVMPEDQWNIWRNDAIFSCYNERIGTIHSSCQHNLRSLKPRRTQNNSTNKHRADMDLW